MKAFALILVLATLAVGTYMSMTGHSAPVPGAAMVEDTVDSQLAAPVRPDRPL